MQTSRFVAVRAQSLAFTTKPYALCQYARRAASDTGHKGLMPGVIVSFLLLSPLFVFLLPFTPLRYVLICVI